MYNQDSKIKIPESNLYKQEQPWQMKAESKIMKCL